MYDAGFGIPLSLLVRFVQKLVLDSTGFVQLRNPYDAGGAYYCFNAVMTHISCFVAAALYSAYATHVAPSNKSPVPVGGNYTGANSVVCAAADCATANESKIDNLTLFAAVVTLSAVWAIAFAGLLLTMKREYVGSFVSLQTGCAYSRSHF
jgi:hypothetical protein